MSPATTSLLPTLVRRSALALTLAACPSVLFAQQPDAVEKAPVSNAISAKWASRVAKEPILTHDQKLALIKKDIRYVFVLFQENRSFDFYFGNYPGADGLYNKPASQVAGFTQPIVNLDGTVTTISPFRIPITVKDKDGNTVPIYPTDIDSVDHSHVGISRKLDLDANGLARNDQYALSEEGVTLADGKPSKLPSLARKQMGELVMAHVDCDIAPFLWQYADRFTLFDHFFDTVVGPSGPNAIGMISGQTGETQWMLHPELAEGAHGATMPTVGNARPYWGLAQDEAGNPVQPKPNPEKTFADNLTYASLPLSFMGSDIVKTTQADYNPAIDLGDVQDDIEKIAGHGVAPINWGWYQQGYAHEPNDPAGKALHVGYVAHHNAPQYFGYVADNPLANVHMHSLNTFFSDVAERKLPGSGVFYIRGGYGNIFGFTPADPSPNAQKNFAGDDDHPGYSDSGISEAMLAREINAIAQSPYWPHAAILIAYDETDGLYDHTQPHIRSHDAKGLPLDQGPRIPFLLISPYGASHAISHAPSEHSSIIKFVDELFDLIPLADLPDELKARKIGHEKYGQDFLGPADDLTPGVSDLLTGFDNARLLGKRKLLPASYAIIPETQLTAFPHYGGQGCKTLHIKPTDADLPNPVPADFNPRPNTTPGDPHSGNWKP
ncbi:phospholipase C [Bryocella elongata]|uniref:Phospholipase C n=1 Tax=Bryocella elongata TaxID=863522 RepID=A0A1H5SK33_9BACT|nr:alkaline phosphatase family protein [Bryocella elongata]SEF50804.1 phospholipase C [Bryocella elongata]